MKNGTFSVKMSKNGSIENITLQSDTYGANFLLCSAADAWVPEDKQFGLGFISAGFSHVQFGKCESVEESERGARSVYTLSYLDTRAGCVWDADIEKSKCEMALRVTVTREVCDDALYETFDFENLSPRYAQLDEIGLYSSFRDVYAAGAGALEHYFNQHICTAGDLSFIRAERQSGRGENLALITLDGKFDTYQIEEQNTSNHRGVIALISKDVRIAAGGHKIIRRAVLPFRDRAEFYRKLLDLTGYPTVDYGNMVVPLGEKIVLTVSEKGSLSSVKMGGTELTEKDGRYEFTPSAVGECIGRIRYGGKNARLTYRVIEDPDVLMKKRAEFIVAHQQVTDENDPRYGAFLVYDVDEERIVRTEEIEDLYHDVPDKNDARERHGMGAFLARYVRTYHDMRFMKNLLLHRDFLLRCIVDDAGDVWDTYLKQDGAVYYERDGLRLSTDSPDMRYRTHNYAFAVPFFAEMYLLTGEELYAQTVLKIMDKYFAKSTVCSFMPDVEDLCLTEELKKKYADLYARVKAGARHMLDGILHSGGNFTADETAYEQGATASNLRFMTDYYFANGDKNALGAMEDELRRTESFDGDQPHYFQHGVPIRHWDSFWFGKYEIWGDTMPHWVSCQSACGYCNVWKITGDEKYREKALRIFRANMALINADGSAYNSFIFNEKTNGRPAGRYDSFSNDQDWIYYYYLKYVKAIGD